ncbi:MAG: hypothetical protein ACLURG_14730 [Gemmiger sp.]
MELISSFWDGQVVFHDDTLDRAAHGCTNLHSRSCAMPVRQGDDPLLTRFKAWAAERPIIEPGSATTSFAKRGWR